MILVAFGRRFCGMRAQKLAISVLTLYRLGSLKKAKKKTKKKRTHTRTSHDNQQDEPRPPYKSGFGLSLSMGRAVAPPNHGAAALQHHAKAASYRGRARCRWFACLGRVGHFNQKIERGGCFGLKWLPFIQINNNQMEDGFDVRGCD